MIMAGVIARVSILKKEKAKRAQLASNKCAYIIKEFDRTFQPEKHNIFLVRRATYLQQKGALTHNQQDMSRDRELQKEALVGQIFSFLSLLFH